MATLAEITAQIQQRDQEIAELRRQAEELRSHERVGVIEELRKKIAEYGITAADLKLNGRGASTGTKRSVSAAPTKSASVVKYRSPTGETWSGGRGRKPRWVTEALAAGKSLEEFEVK